MTVLKDRRVAGHRSRATRTERRAMRGGCVVRYDLSIGVLTGLIRHSQVPWDAPDTWWVDALVTFEVGDGVRRTDGYEMGVTMEPGALATAVRSRLQFLFDRICAVEAVVTHVSPPMGGETISMIQEVNAALTKERREAERIAPHEGTKDTKKRE